MATRLDPIDELLEIDEGDTEALFSWNDDNGYSLSRINETNYADRNVDFSTVADPFPGAPPSERVWPLLRTELDSNVTYAVKSAVSPAVLRCVEVLTGDGEYSGRPVLVEAARLAPGSAVTPTSGEALLEDVLKSRAYQSRVAKLEAGGLLVVGAQTAAELHDQLDEPGGAPSAYTILGHVARTYKRSDDPRVMLSTAEPVCYAAVYSVMRNGQLQMVSGDEFARATSGSLLNASWRTRRLDFVALPFESFVVIKPPRSTRDNSIELLPHAGKTLGARTTADERLVADYARRVADELRYTRTTREYTCTARSTGDMSLIEEVGSTLNRKNWTVMADSVDEGASLVRVDKDNTALEFYTSEYEHPRVLSILACTNEKRPHITVIDPALDDEGKTVKDVGGRTLETNQMEMTRQLLRLYRYARPLGDAPTLRSVRAGIADFVTPLDGETAAGTLQASDDENTYLSKQLAAAAADIDALLGTAAPAPAPAPDVTDDEDGDTTEEALSGAEDEIVELQEQNAQLLEQNVALAAEVAALNARIAALEAELAACTSGRGGSAAALRRQLRERDAAYATLEAQVAAETARLREKIRDLQRQLRDVIAASGGGGGGDAEDVALRQRNAELEAEVAALRDEVARLRRGRDIEEGEIVEPLPRPVYGGGGGVFAVVVPAARSELPYNLAALDTAGRLARAAGRPAAMLVAFEGVPALTVRAGAATPFQTSSLPAEARLAAPRAYAVRRAGTSDAHPAPAGLVPAGARAEPRANAAFAVPAAGRAVVTLTAAGGAEYTVGGAYDARAAAARVGTAAAVDLVLGGAEGTLRIRLLGGAPAGQLYWLHAVVAPPAAARFQ